MTTFEILERWAQYTKFDPEQTRFNLLTSEYTLNRCNKRIQELLNNYDPSGTLAVVYAKNICRELLQEKKLTLFEALTELDKYQETKEIWDMHCVNQSDIDRDWSCKDACDHTPGIRKADGKGDEMV